MRTWLVGLRWLAVAALAVGLWAFAQYGTAAPPVLAASAPARQFSAIRAATMLAQVLGPQLPHPNGTPANRAVRARILRVLAQMGIAARTYRGMGCFTDKNTPLLGCGDVVDIVAPVLPGRGKAIVMLAHYDSVPAGPGAADDGCGVAALLETARALRAQRGAGLHPVVALFTDGEEYGMLGAAAYLQDPVLRDGVGIAINIEARGNRGPSRLFQTSPAASKLIGLYARAVPSYAASSLYAEIYRFLPNDTDLTVFLHHHIAGYNFAITGRVAHYHTPLDTLAHLSRSSLQDQGDNLLALVRGLETSHWSELRGHDEVYLSIWGRWLPHGPQSLVLPLSLILFAIVALAALTGAGGLGMRRWLGAILLFPAVVLGSALAGWLVVMIAQAVSGMPDPSYAHPTALRLALSLAVAAVFVGASRWTSARAAMVGVWLWFGALAVAVAAFLPGFSPYFLLPMAAAALLLPLASLFGSERRLGQWALLVPAAVALVIWLQLCAEGESLMGLKLHPLFTVPAAIGMATMLPYLAAVPLPRTVFRGLLGGLVVSAGVIAVVAGLVPAYSRLAPQRLNLLYVQDANRNVWAVQTAAPLPQGLVRAAAFTPRRVRFSADYTRHMFLAPAPHLDLPQAGASIIANVRRSGQRVVVLALHGAADMMTVSLAGAVHLTQVAIGPTVVAIAPQWAGQRRVAIGCLSRDCGRQQLTLVMRDRGALRLSLVTRRNALPAAAAKLLAARPGWAVPSGYGDGTLQIVPIAVPAVP